MPTYDYYCHACEEGFERNVWSEARDVQLCATCGKDAKRLITFNGLTWAPTAGGMR